MSWDIVLLNTKQNVAQIEDIDDGQLEKIDFDMILEENFENIKKDGKHRSIEGKDFSIEYFSSGGLDETKLFNLYGLNGLFELIHLARKYNWVVFDTGNGEIIDLNNPEKNGYEDFQKYLAHVLKK